MNPVLLFSILWLFAASALLLSVFQRPVWLKIGLSVGALSAICLVHYQKPLSGDLPAYKEWYVNMPTENPLSILLSYETAAVDRKLADGFFIFLGFVAKTFDLSFPMFLSLVSAIILMSVFVVFLRDSESYSTAVGQMILFGATPAFVSFNFNIIRQGLALGLFFLALTFIYRKNFGVGILLVLTAISCHWSVALFLPLVIAVWWASERFVHNYRLTVFAVLLAVVTGWVIALNPELVFTKVGLSERYIDYQSGFVRVNHILKWLLHLPFLACILYLGQKGKTKSFLFEPYVYLFLIYSSTMPFAEASSRVGIALYVLEPIIAFEFVRARLPNHAIIIASAFAVGAFLLLSRSRMVDVLIAG